MNKRSIRKFTAMKSERQQAILDLLDQHHSVTVNEISNTLGVSDMTIRRDLAELADKGLLVRVHGGAQLPRSARGTTLSRLISHEEKRHFHVDQKRAAAMAAARTVSAGDTIFLGGGSTLELMCSYLPQENIRVVTNSLPVLNLLADNPHVDLFFIGGMMRHDTRVFTMPYNGRGLYGLSAPKAYVSATGVFGNEVFGSRPDATMVLSDALAHAQERYLVVDAEKVGRRDFCLFTTLEEMTAAFVNADADPQTLEALSAYTSVVTA